MRISTAFRIERLMYATIPAVLIVFACVGPPNAIYGQNASSPGTELFTEQPGGAGPTCEATVIPATDFQTISSAIDPGEFKDFCFNATAGRVYDFTTCAPGAAGFDTVIEIWDTAGRTRLAFNDDFCDVQSYVSWRATSTGSFRARVLGFGDESGDFTLAYRASPLSTCTDISVTPDSQFIENSIDPGRSRDYCFDGVPGQQYEFMTCTPGSADFHTFLELRAETGELLANEQNPSPCGFQSRLVATTAAARRLRVRIRGAATEDGGSFRLAYRIYRPPCVAITPDEDLQMSSGRLPPNTFKDYCFPATAGKVYEFRTCPPGRSDAASSIDIRDASGATTIAPEERTGCSPMTGQRVLFKANSSGQFRARVNHSAPGGAYTLAYQLYAAPECTDITLADDFQAESDTLAPSDFKDYCFTARAGEAYEFSTCAPGNSSFISGADTLQVRDDYGIRTLALQARSFCPPELGTQISFRAPSAETFRIRVKAPATGGDFTMAYRKKPTPWAARAPVPVRDGLSETTVVAVDGIIYVIGGGLGPGPNAQTNQVWAYDPAKDSWTRMTDIPVNPGIRALGSAAALDGIIYVFGGFNGQTLNTTWSYTIAEDRWLQRANMPGSRYGAAVAAVNGKIIVAGGSDGVQAQTTTWEYDPKSDTFTIKAPLPAVQRVHGVPVVMEDRAEVRVFGGVEGRTHLYYDVLTDNWRSGPPIPNNVLDPAVVLVGNAIYVIGGSSQPRTQIYDLARNIWSQGPLLPGVLERTGGSKVDNNLIIVGGVASGLSVPFTYSLEVE